MSTSDPKTAAPEPVEGRDTADSMREPAKGPNPSRPLRRFLGSFWGQLLLAFLTFALVLTFVAKPYRVPSGSMENTLLPGDRVLVNRLAYRFGDPAPGDVVVFDADSTWDSASTVEPDGLRALWLWLGSATGFGPSGAHTLVKRVIATPGQTASCCSADGRLVVEAQPLDEPYVANDFPFSPGTLDCATIPRSQRCFDEVTVPEDSYLVLGDNRSNSSDSAAHCRAPDADESTCWRWATREGLVGRVVAVLWPISRWRGAP